MSARVTIVSQFAWGHPGFNTESFVSQETLHAWVNLNGWSLMGNRRISKNDEMERTHSERDSLCKGPKEDFKNSW